MNYILFVKAFKSLNNLRKNKFCFIFIKFTFIVKQVLHASSICEFLDQVEVVSSLDEFNGFHHVDRVEGLQNA
jgi:hypothetical protein